jgi:hypothetical protein
MQIQYRDLIPIKLDWEAYSFFGDLEVERGE